MGIDRKAGAAVALVATLASCTPSPHPARSGQERPVTTPSDTRLLQGLALEVPRADAGATLPAPARIDVPPPFAMRGAATDDEARAADCLSAAVYYEARSEPVDGQRAVAQVVLNRVRDRAFPASICRVVYQRSSRGCQFSFACDGSTDRPVEPRAWALAGIVARAALAGSVYAPVGAATHYHTTAILPWWAPSLARIGTIGHHIFYTWGNRLGQALSFRQAYAGEEPAPRIALRRAAPAPISEPPSDAGEQPVVAAAVAVHRGTAPGLVALAGFGVRVHRGMGLAVSDAADVPVEVGD